MSKQPNVANNISRRDFIKSVFAFLAFFSIGGISALFSKKEEVSKTAMASKGGYGRSGYGM